jgi:hypothetical protein
LVGTWVCLAELELCARIWCNLTQSFNVPVKNGAFVNVLTFQRVKISSLSQELCRAQIGRSLALLIPAHLANPRPRVSSWLSTACVPIQSRRDVVLSSRGFQVVC